MNTATFCIILIFVGYVAGSIPFGYLLARWFRGIDIRTKGSGNIGATNIGRVMGKKWGIAVLAFDALKGYLPVFLAPMLLMGNENPNVEHCRILTGVMTIIGHMFPVWLKFRGGKGVATALGVVIALALYPALIAVGAYLVILFLSRIPSLSSITAVLTFAIVYFISLGFESFATEKLSLTVFTLAVPVLVIVRHWSNIKRIAKGEEPRFEFGNSQKNTASIESSTAEETIRTK